MKSFDNIINEWPEVWKFEEEDVAFGEKLIVEIKPFVAFLIESKLSERTIKRHVDNLWFLGGEIIRGVAMGDEYDFDPLEKLKDSVSSVGGMFCKYIYLDSEQKSYDATCRKLHKFLEKNGR